MTHATEHRVRELAAEVYTPDGVEVFMRGYNHYLKGVPADLIAAGDGDRVEQLLAALIDGAYL